MSEARPLADFTWNGDVVGMGYLPEEVALPLGWRWDARPVSPRP